MKIQIEHNNQLYEINGNEGTGISIPVNFNKDQNPKFYDINNPQKKYYQSNQVEYSL